MKKKSWKTTILGVIAAVGILSTQVTALLDEDPATVFDVAAIFAALSVFGIGVAARDHSVTSEQAGAK